MTYSIIYSSKTGNTELLAEKIKTLLSEYNCIYYGPSKAEAAAADILFIGFWTDKGSCDETIASFLKSLHEKKIFLFGTAGFGGSEAYFSQILSRVKANLDVSNSIIDTFMCQGKMPISVRQRYESLMEYNTVKMQELINNFDCALTHPDTSDLIALEQSIQNILL